MLGRHSSIIVPPGTGYAEEMCKWESGRTEFGVGQRPYVFRDYPKRIYRAFKGTEPGVTFEGHTVNDEVELANMQSRGFHPTQQLALDAFNREHTEHGKLAAERNYEIKHGRISDGAAAEVRAAEAAHGSRHLPMVPETPIVKRRTRGPNKPKVSI